MRSDKELKRSELIRERFKIVSKRNELTYSDELHLAQYLFDKLHLVPLAEAASRSGMSYNGMKRRVKVGKEMYIECGETLFVSSPA